MCHAVGAVASLAYLLCRTRLTGNGERLGACRLTQTIVHHLTQHVLHLLQRTVVVDDALSQHLHGVLLHRLSTSHYALDETRAYHHAVICNGIIERKHRYRRHVSLISYAHPWQCGVTPSLCPVTILVTLWITYARSTVFYELQFQVLSYSHTVQACHKFLRTVMVSLVYQHADTYV